MQWFRFRGLAVGSTVVSGWRQFHLRGLGFRVAGTEGGPGSGERGTDSVPSSGDLFGPPPGLVDAEPGLPGAVADPGGDVQHPVPECRDLASGEVWFVREAEQFGPGNEVHRGHHDLQPGIVGCKAIAGKVPQPDGFRLPDPVLHPSVLAVPQVQTGQLAGHDPGWGVGDEGDDPMSVDVGEHA